MKEKRPYVDGLRTAKRLVSSRIDGGARRLDRYVKDGRVWEIGRKMPLETPEEADVFEALGVPWVPVEERDRGYWGMGMRDWPCSHEHGTDALRLGGASRV